MADTDAVTLAHDTYINYWHTYILAPLAAAVILIRDPAVLLILYTIQVRSNKLLCGL